MSRDDVLKELNYVPGPVPDAYESDHIERELLQVSDVLQRLQDPGYTDMGVAAHGIALPGAGTDPARDSGSGLLRFGPSTIERVYLTFQMPHSWVVGTSLYPHIHWAKSTSATGNVAWRCLYKKWKVNSALDANWTSLGTVTTPATPSSNTVNVQMITAFPALDMSDMDLSETVFFEIDRLGADPGDTYGGDAQLIEFDFHLQVNRWGSTEQFAH